MITKAIKHITIGQTKRLYKPVGYTMLANFINIVPFCLSIEVINTLFKAFDGTASPNFDLANFDAFTRSLLTEPERLDTDHLVFEYFLQAGGVVTINNIWVKKIWEMAGPSDTNILNLQVKQGVPVNIRPKNWRSNSPRITFFGQRLDFVIALDQALQHFYPNRHINWLATVQQNYLIRTGQVL